MYLKLKPDQFDEDVLDERSDVVSGVITITSIWVAIEHTSLLVRVDDIDIIKRHLRVKNQKLKFYPTTTNKKKSRTSKNVFWKIVKTMKFCKKCHRRIPDKFNDSQQPWIPDRGIKKCLCDNPKFIMRRRNGINMAMIGVKLSED